MQKNIVLLGPLELGSAHVLFSEKYPHKVFSSPQEFLGSEEASQAGLLVLGVTEIDAVSIFVRSRQVPLLVVVPTKSIGAFYDGLTGLDIPVDFVWPNCSREELSFRIDRLFQNGRSRELALDPVGYVLRKGGQQSEVLTLKEYQILQAILASPKRSLPRERLIKQIWGDRRTSPKVLDVHLSNLRKKLRQLALTVRATQSGSNTDWSYELAAI